MILSTEYKGRPVEIHFRAYVAKARNSGDPDRYEPGSVEIEVTEILRCVGKVPRVEDWRDVPRPMQDEIERDNWDAMIEMARESNAD